MADEQQPSPSAVGTIVTGEDQSDSAVAATVTGDAALKSTAVKGSADGLLAAVNQIGMSGAVETAANIRAAVEQIGSVLRNPTAIYPDGFPRETWRDWMEPDAPNPDVLLTRKELLERLQAEGVDVTPSALAYWENQRITPRGDKRWINGTPQSLYPEWMIPMLRTVRALQEDGVSLREIRETLRTISWMHPAEVSDQPPDDRSEHSALREEFLRMGTEDLRPLLLEYARLQERISGVRVVRIELQMIDAQGQRFRHGFS